MASWKYLTSSTPLKTILNIPRNISTIVLLSALKDAEKRLDNDSILFNSVAMSKKVVLLLFFNLGNPIDKCLLPAYRITSKIICFSSVFLLTVLIPAKWLCQSMSLPKTLRLGHLNIIADTDGIVCSKPLFINFKDRPFPSFALQLTLKYLDLDLKDLQLGSQLKFNSKTIPIYGNNKMLINFKSGIPYYSFFEVINKKIPPEVFTVIG
jgi:serine/threonine-protein kinase